MELIEINMIRAKASKAFFCCGNQVRPLEIPRKHLSCEKHLVSLTFDCLAYNFLGSICLRRVNETGAAFDRRPKRFDASSVIPGAESDFGQTNTAVGQFS